MNRSGSPPGGGALMPLLSRRHTVLGTTTAQQAAVARLAQPTHSSGTVGGPAICPAAGATRAAAAALQTPHACEAAGWGCNAAAIQGRKGGWAAWRARRGHPRRAWFAVHAHAPHLPAPLGMLTALVSRHSPASPAATARDGACPNLWPNHGPGRRRPCRRRRRSLDRRGWRPGVPLVVAPSSSCCMAPHAEPANGG